MRPPKPSCCRPSHIFGVGARTTASRTRISPSASGSAVYSGSRVCGMRRVSVPCSVRSATSFGRPSCALSCQLSHGDAATLAGMGPRFGDDNICYSGVRSRRNPVRPGPMLIQRLPSDDINNLTMPKSAPAPDFLDVRESNSGDGLYASQTPGTQSSRDGAGLPGMASRTRRTNCVRLRRPLGTATHPAP